MKRIFFGPSDWLASRTSARERRAWGFWLGVVFVLATILTWTSVEKTVALRVLQALTLLLLCWSIVTTETPVEEE